jgi:hypothetical protein
MDSHPLKLNVSAQYIVCSFVSINKLCSACFYTIIHYFCMLNEKYIADSNGDGFYTAVTSIHTATAFISRRVPSEF